MLGSQVQKASGSVPSGTSLPGQASPPRLCPHGRTRDLEALLAVMGGAREFIYASVMEYFPTTRFSHPPRWVWAGARWPWRVETRSADGQLLVHPCSPMAGRQGSRRSEDPDSPSRRYWPALDTALRTAAFNRGVRVRLLVSCWPHTDPSMFPELRSLQAFSNPAAGVSVDVVRACSPGRAGGGGPPPLPDTLPLCSPKKVFIVPVGNHSNIPFSRVNHSKFMVTEKAAYIGEHPVQQPQDPWVFEACRAGAQDTQRPHKPTEGGRDPQSVAGPGC